MVFRRSFLTGAALGILAVTMQVLTAFLPMVFFVAIGVGNLLPGALCGPVAKIQDDPAINVGRHLCRVGRDRGGSVVHGRG